MYQNFNFINLNDLLKKENGTKLIIIGITLILISVISFFNKSFGIRLISYTLATLLLYISYLTLVNINELRRYESSDKIRPYNISLAITLVISIILFIFPNRVQSFISTAFGVYIVFNQIMILIKSKDNPYYNFSTFNIIKLVFGLTLIVSPLFLSSFISSLISLLGVIIGGYILSLGKSIR